MPNCDHCSTDVKKLLIHPETLKEVCFSCLPQAEEFDGEDLELGTPIDDERRRHLRVPVSFPVTFETGDDDSMLQLSHPGITVDVSLGGVCFAWEPGTVKGDGYQDITPDSLFYPYCKSNQSARELNLHLCLGITEVKIPAKVVYIQTDADIGIEYVGTEFGDLSKTQQTAVEKILYK